MRNTIAKSVGVITGLTVVKYYRNSMQSSMHFLKTQLGGMKVTKIAPGNMLSRISVLIRYYMIDMLFPAKVKRVLIHVNTTLRLTFFLEKTAFPVVCKIRLGRAHTLYPVE